MKVEKATSNPFHFRTTSFCSQARKTLSLMSTTFAWWCITYFNIFTFESDILNFQFSCFISSFGHVFLKLLWYNSETLKRGIFVDLSLPSLQIGSMVETLGLVSINTNSHYHLLPMTVCELFKAITQAKKSNLVSGNQPGENFFITHTHA